MAKVKAHARPWRSIFLLVLAVVMATVSRSARTAAASAFFPDTAYRALGHTGTDAVADAAAVAFCLLAFTATAGFAGRTRKVLQPKIGAPHTAVIRYAMVLLGGLATLLIALQLFGIAVNQLLLGGAFATILVGIAAQQSLSNVLQAWSCCSPGRSTSATRCGSSQGRWVAIFAGKSPRLASPTSGWIHPMGRFTCLIRSSP